MQTWRRTELLQMLEVTTIGSHTCSQAPAEVLPRLVDGFLWQLFPDDMQSNFQLTNCLRVRLEFYGTVPAWHLRHDSPAGTNLNSLGPLILLNEAGSVRLRPVLRDA